MKNLFALLFLFLLLVAIFCAPTLATPQPLVSVTINNATNSVNGLLAFPYNPQLQGASITHGALTTTNELKLDIYSNFQGATTNGRVYVGTWYATTTNSATETIVGSSYQMTNFLSIDIGTTNAVSVSGYYGN